MDPETPRPTRLPWELIERYLANDVSEPERTHIEAVLDASPQMRQALEAFHTAIDRAMPEPPIAQREHDLVALHRQWRTDAQRVSYAEPSRSSKQQRPHTYRFRLAIGATMATIAAIALLWGTQRTQSPHNETTYRTTAGQQARITLADGTAVTLAPHTTLVVHPERFTTRRTVALTGEAFFEVDPTHHTPFIVQTGSVQTRVLGTRFSVQRRDASGIAQIVVLSGKVAVEARDTRAVLTAGSAVTATDSTVTETSIGVLPQYTDWSTHHLVFRGVSIATMLDAIGQWYGYRFQLSDSTLAARTISAAFKTNDLSDTFIVLRGLLDVDLDVTRNTVTLTPRVTEKRMPMERQLFNHPILEKGR